MIDIVNGTLRISVRNLVEFICRKGDIDNRFSGVTDKTAMDAGSRAHRKIQKSMGGDYNAEVSLSYTYDNDIYDITVEGRADGIFNKDGYTYVDEIKGTYKDVKYLSEPVEVHKAQAMCYAYIYALKNNLDTIGLRMTYVNLTDEAIKYFTEVMSFEELKKWFEAVLSELIKWGNYVYYHRKSRNISIKELEFPFEYREGQRNLAVSVYKAIKDNHNLYIQAPTGVGKTISTVFPAVKSMGEEYGDKIFYLTAKTITRTAAEDTFGILRRNNLDFKTLTITAKDKLCLCDGEDTPECNPFSCPYAKGHYDRINGVVYDMINNLDVITRDVIEEYAKKNTVCPFELCLDLSYWMDGIICDYNYVFDPEVKLKRFFSEGSKDEYIFLVDEAHNLVDRARNMYSAQIYKEDVLSVKKLVAGYSKKLAGILERCNRYMLEMKRKCDEEYMIEENDNLLSISLKCLETEITHFMENNRDFPYMTELLEFFFNVCHFNAMYEKTDENYVKYCEHTERGFMYRLFCVNPGNNIRECVDSGRNAVFFSATLLPVNYYKELLTGDINEPAIYVNSPFDVNKRLLVIGNDVTSRYTRRNTDEFTKVKEYILRITGSRKGNYLVFFPSYKYMKSVYELFYGEKVRVIIQNNNMSEKDREEFLAEFDNNGDDVLLGFCVLGGLFSEGIDLKKDSLIGSIIVGTGLPSISTENSILKTFYDERENKGYEYAYVYPGMNKVLQAAGRVIRTDEDTGVIALLDDRFLWDRYVSLFPKEWKNYHIVNIENVNEEILDFWRDVIYNTTESV